MAILCDSCGKVITTIYLIRKDNLSFCSYRCYKNITNQNGVDYIIQKKVIGHDLLGITSAVKRNDAFLKKGDVTGNSMVQATSFERIGEFKKAINCWKRILILHDDDKTIVERANSRIKTLERKLKSKHQGLKEGNSGKFEK
jgi:hypothetical protein